MVDVLDNADGEGGGICGAATAPPAAAATKRRDLMIPRCQEPVFQAKSRIYVTAGAKTVGSTALSNLTQEETASPFQGRKQCIMSDVRKSGSNAPC